MPTIQITYAFLKPNLLLLILIFISRQVAAQMEPLGVFDHHQDVGNPALKGSAIYDTASQTYVLSGAGANMWTNTDQFHFAWKKIKGDFIIRATVRFTGKGAEAHRKMGIIARDRLTADSRYADGCEHGDDLTSLQYRQADGDTTGEVVVSSYHPTEIEFERSGDIFTFSTAVFGETYKSVSKQLQLNEEIYAGIFICSHLADVIEKAVFSNVRIILPAPAGFVPYRDYIGSQLEIMDVATGHRKVLHNAPNSLQAPNWTRDNSYLIYNEEGYIYKYGLKNNTISKLNTGFATDNNNDHVLSFDGKMIGISNHTGDKHTSTIYVLPVTGSDSPAKITSENSGASYLHGWSPDGKKLLFTGQRNNQWDIWSVDIASHKEVQLTGGTTLDDGPEFTPDGKYIYYNSVRTGTMKIWRMNADGSDEQQITFDEYNDWFPHISPDGKWMVYLSFPGDIDPASHPFYKKIYLRLLPLRGGVPKTIAYIYGGQGTINVPSWSPDSRKIAFISNTRF